MDGRGQRKCGQIAGAVRANIPGELTRVAITGVEPHTLRASLIPAQHSDNSDQLRVDVSAVVFPLTRL
jgi:hypothetical protein